MVELVPSIPQAEKAEVAVALVAPDQADRIPAPPPSVVPGWISPLLLAILLATTVGLAAVVQAAPGSPPRRPPAVLLPHASVSLSANGSPCGAPCGAPCSPAARHTRHGLGGGAGGGGGLPGMRNLRLSEEAPWSVEDLEASDDGDVEAISAQGELRWGVWAAIASAVMLEALSRWSVWR